MTTQPINDELAEERNAYIEQLCDAIVDAIGGSASGYMEDAAFIIDSIEEWTGHDWTISSATAGRGCFVHSPGMMTCITYAG